MDEMTKTALRWRPNTALDESSRDIFRATKLSKPHELLLASKLAYLIAKRLQMLQTTVSAEHALWIPFHTDPDRAEGSQRQSVLADTLEFTEQFRAYVSGKLLPSRLPQCSDLHPEAVTFFRVVKDVARQNEYWTECLSELTTKRP